MTTVYRIATGHITQAALQANAAYVVANFSKNAVDEVWSVETSGIVSHGTRINVTLGSKVRGAGNVLIPPWYFIVSAAQSATLVTTYDKQQVTIQMLDVPRNTWEAYQTTAYVNFIAADFEVTGKNQVNKLRFDFVPGVIAPAS